jgi:dynein heavy chain
LLISENDRSREGSPTESAVARSNSRKSRPVSSKANAAAKKKREMRENLEEAAADLLAHFEHRNQDALMKVTRNTLEALKKRISSSSMLHYMGMEILMCFFFYVFFLYLSYKQLPLTLNHLT